MAIAFISDLHLEPIENIRLKTFYNLLSEANSRFDSLYIIGDLFEYWIGDDDQHPVNKDIIQNIKKATDSGLNIFLIQSDREMIGEEKGGPRKVSERFCKVF